MKHPFSLPARLSPDLARVESYWRSLLRGGAQMPFWDDAKLTDLPELTSRLLLIDAFDRPQRFRFGTVGADVGGSELEGRFLDETDLDSPLEFLLAQCSATIEAASPTFLRAEGGAGRPYGRLVLPMWGDGRTSMLLAAVEFG